MSFMATCLLKQDVQHKQPKMPCQCRYSCYETAKYDPQIINYLRENCMLPNFEVSHRSQIMKQKYGI